jgi:hypothetical protein
MIDYRPNNMPRSIDPKKMMVGTEFRRRQGRCDQRGAADARRCRSAKWPVSAAIPPAPGVRSTTAASNR